MRMPQRTWMFVLLVTLMASGSASVVTQTESGTPKAALRDGQRDFDFEIGSWKTHVKRLERPLTGSTSWTEFDGITIVREIWEGANMSVLEADAPTGHLQALSLRLYDRQSRQWSLSYANSAGGAMGVPSIGEFKDGRGEFFDTEPYNGRNIMVRQVWSSITSDSSRFEQAFSTDWGKTWEVNWIATYTRTPQSSGKSQNEQAARAEQDGRRDFDWDMGTWKTHQKRLLNPLAGSATWVEYDGTDVVSRIWDGANQGIVKADGPTGHLEIYTLRIYNPQAHQWHIYFANKAGGTLSQPVIGEFKKGRGEFIDQEPYKDKAILVRFTVADITPDSCHFEQAFSADGGKTWEPNFVVTEMLVKNEPGNRR